MAAIDDFPNADVQFYQMALQYYAAGRFAGVASLMPVSGNIVHHAVEMMLKGRLTHTLTLKQMAGNPYSHCLPRLWQEFKGLFPHESLTRFDAFIGLLHQFDSIRYPDRILREGAHMTVGLVTSASMPPPTPTPVEPGFVLSITELDDLMNELFRICSVNPQAFLHPYNDATDIIVRDNVRCQGWFPGRAQQ